MKVENGGRQTITDLRASLGLVRHATFLTPRGEEKYPIDALETPPVQSTTPPFRILHLEDFQQRGESVSLKDNSFSERERNVLRNILTQKYHVEFHPRTRSVSVPIINRKHATMKEHTAYPGELYLWSGRVMEYIEGQVITDKFCNNDFYGRNRWEEQMQKQYGDLFYQVYRNGNQISTYALTRMNFALQYIAANYQEQEGQDIAKQILTLAESLRQRAVAYGTKNIEEKAEIARENVDVGILALNLVYGTTYVTPISVT